MGLLLKKPLAKAAKAKKQKSSKQVLTNGKKCDRIIKPLVQGFF